MKRQVFLVIKRKLKKELNHGGVVKMKRIKEWFSIKAVKSPRSIVLLSVLVANVAFIGVASLIISWLAPASLEDGGFWNSVFNTIIMYLGIGGIDTVIEDISHADAFLVLFSIIIVIIGLVFFTYALIGYMSELISNFIGNADSGSKKLFISNHIVILNWNSRAVETINDLLYKNSKEKIVILTGTSREDVQRDIEERVIDTLETENETIKEVTANMGFIERWRYTRKNKLRNRLTIIIREGNTCSSKQLSDISIVQARSIIILSGGDNEIAVDSHTIKTLIQVVQLTTQEPMLGQQTVVEVEDEKTLALVEKIIKHKMESEKCNIVPVPVNRILGYVFSQFSIMPELNLVYSAIFSFKSADLYTLPINEPSVSEREFVSKMLDNNVKAVPLTIMNEENGKFNSYYLAESGLDIHSIEPIPQNRDYSVSLNPNYEIEERHVIILGHSSKNLAMMDGFATFNSEWKKKDGTKVLDVTIIDDEENLRVQNHYKQYPWVRKIISADITEHDVIMETISEFIDVHSKGGCVLILSDDTASGEDVDESALTYLILVQDVIHNRLEMDSSFDANAIDVIVEIVDPKNHDIVNQYNMKNVVISNRYISKLIMQVGENKALYDFYQDVLTYDDVGASKTGSKELYIRKTSAYFSELPKPANATDLIRAIYNCSPDDNKSILLGYFCPDGKMILFTGENSNINVALTGDEKLIIFCDH